MPTFNRDNVSSRPPPSRRSRPRRAHRRRRRARDRRARPGDRLQGVRLRQHAAIRGPRRRRRRLAEWWDDQPLAGLRGRQRPGLPELVLDPRSLRLQRPVLLRPDRDPDAPHRALPEARPQTRATRVEITPEANRRYFESMLAPPPQPGLLPGRLRGRQQLLLRQARRRAVPARATLEAAWRSARFDLDDYGFTG